MHIGKNRQSLVSCRPGVFDIVSIRADPTVPIEHTVGALAELVKLRHSLAFTHSW
jgi:hypothetical protein